MNVQELYDEACELHKAKNYDATFKILDEIKMLAPKFKRAYYLEAQVWESLGNYVKEYYALEKILPLLDFSAPEEKIFVSGVLGLMGYVCEQLGLPDESKKFYLVALKMLPPPKTEQMLNSLIFRENMREDSTPESFRALYDEYKKFWRTSNLIRENFTITKKFAWASSQEIFTVMLWFNGLAPC